MSQDGNMANGHPEDGSEPLAIIGLATRFPQESDSTESLWKFLVQGRNAATPFPEDRIGPGHYHPDPEHGGTHAVQNAHFLREDPAYFDAPFFSITKGEAVVMDPQQRLVLENVYLALENAGLPIDKVAASNTSVFVSGFNHDHAAILNADTEASQRYKATGLTNSMLSNRVSWFFDLKGPSATLDTACSSSMVALHLGAQSLKTGDSDMAIINGVTVINYPGDLSSMSYQGFLGQKGKCFTFDHRADGYARGEGVGSVVVKRLRDAIRDGDTIRSVIRGSSVNQDGRTPGLTLPDSGAQDALIKRTYASAKLDFDQTMMLESHGTGTSAGDPIEANGIARGFSSRKKDKPLYVGAMKAALGHLEGAAGIAGVIKAVLVLENGIIPPNATFEKANSKIAAKKWNLHFPQKALPWPTEGLRRVSVNSFGVGGTNGHVIMDDAYYYLQDRGLHAPHHTRPNVPKEEEIAQLVSKWDQTFEEDHLETKDEGATNVNGTTNGVAANGDLTNGHTNGDADSIGDEWSPFAPIEPAPKLIPLSTFDEEGISRITKTHAEFLETMEPLHSVEEARFVQDYAHTIAQRSRFPWRSYALAKSHPELRDVMKGPLPKAIRARGSTQIGFVFTGQGAQWFGMARELLCYPVFRDGIAAASSAFKSMGSEWSLLEELARGKEDTNVHKAYIAQPACTAIQVGVVDLLRSFGIRPSRVTGHSSGEIAAAYCAGKLSKEGAFKASYMRGLVSNQATKSKGSMLAVGLAKDAVQPYVERIDEEISGALVVACINSPKNCTVSGDEAKIDALRNALDQDGIFARKLNVNNAYHSSHMKEIASEYLNLLGELPAPEDRPLGTCHMFSTVTGKLVDSEVLGADYWVENLINPVRFSEGISGTCFTRTEKGQASLRTDTSAGNIFTDVLIEIGPHGALQSAIKDNLSASAEGAGVTSLSVLNRSAPGVQTILSTAGHLFSRGYPVDIQAVNQSSKLPGSEVVAPKLLVDLPGYAFNHSNKFWFESRLSKNYRLRKHAKHDLFGAPVPDWNAEAPRWRNILRLSEQPWLRDHAVTNSFVLPGVAYLIAAIEASRQLLDPKASITGFRLKDISLKRALIIPDNKDGVEVQLSLNRFDESSVDPSSLWRKFLISSYNPSGDDWIEHCTGYIAMEHENAPGPIDQGREGEEETKAWEAKLAECEGRCTSPLDIDRAYDNLQTTGLQFGPLFRNVTAMTGTPQNIGQVLGTVSCPEIAESMPKKHLSPHLMHPATMDSMMHFALAAMMDSMNKTSLDVPMVPTFIKEVWIASNLNAEPGHQYRVSGITEQIAYDKYQSHITAWDGPTREPRISIKGIRATPLDSTGDSSTSTRKLCHEMKWVPYMDMTSSEQLGKAAGVVEKDHSEELEATTKLQLTAMLLVTDALDELDHKLPEQADGHLIRYFDWMQQLQAWINEDKLAMLPKAQFDKYKHDAALKAELYEWADNHNADGRLCLRMGNNIVPFLRKEGDALDLMFGKDDILDHVYADLAHLNDLPALQEALYSTVAENDTNLEILEVGAGVGSSTKVALDNLAPTTEDDAGKQWSVSHYTYTDISSAFFDKAKDKFKAHQDIMEYKVFDADKDPEDQGHRVGAYDFVIAQNVIHATSDLHRTLSNLRKVLKPGGRLLLQEGIRQDYFWSAIAFGQLPGWWMGKEPARKLSPFITPEQWETHLKSADFSGVELNLKDSQQPDIHTQSLMISQAVEPGAENTFGWQEVAIVTASAAQSSSELVSSFKSHLEEKVRIPSVKVVDFSQLKDADLSKCLCISLAELERSILAEISEVEYEGMRKMLTLSKGVMWVTGDMVKTPEFGMVLGMFRTIRWERDLDEANMVTLSVAQPQPATTTLIESITKLCKQQFSSAFPVAKYQGEYRLQDGSFSTARLYTGTSGDNFLTSKFQKLQPVMMPLKDAGRPVKLASSAPGMLDKLEWVTDPIYEQSLGETQVEIDHKAVGLNFRDLMVAMGEAMSYSLGCEASGFISRVGAKVTDVKVGDRITYICGLEDVGCFHTFGRVDQSAVVPIPEDLSFEIAASLPVVWATVLYGLRNAGRLAKGEKILIHAAAGGIGQAAINYAKYVGAEVFATVSSPEKRQLLVDEFGIPEDHIFSSRDLTFVQGVMRMTNDQGVDVVLNSLSGEALRRSWSLIAPFGRFVEIGKQDAQKYGRLDLSPFLTNVTMTSVDLVTMMHRKPLLLRELVGDAIALWTAGIAKPAAPTKVMSMARTLEAFQTLQSGKGVGKMVLVPHPDDIVPVVPTKPKPHEFKSDATYVLSGGLGGLGRSIARFMTAHGARHFVFLSSSGNLTEPVRQMMTDLEEQGATIDIFKCDVGDRATLQNVIEKCKATMPPIKGVIQGAMKLEDTMFENMSHTTFTLATHPKVQGSRNLHDLLPRDLDHFLMLSSATGILGNRAQANYAAGNTYQDALAHHRRSLGLAASTLDVGTVLSVGYVAENRARIAVNKSLGTLLETIREEEIHALLEYLLTPTPTAADSASPAGPPAQLVSGLTTMETYRARAAPAPTYMSYPLFTHLRALAAQPSNPDASPTGPDTTALLTHAPDLAAATAITLSAMRAKLASLLSIPEDEISVDKSVSANGVDSLVAMEFRTFLARTVKADVPVLEIMGTGSLGELAGRVAGWSRLVRVGEGEEDGRGGGGGGRGGRRGGKGGVR